MKTLNYNQFLKMFEPGKNHPIIVNTLPKEDYMKGHIPGSINVPAPQITKKAPELFSKHDWIVVYCANTQCQASHDAATELEKLGYTNVYRFVGGLQEWTQNNKYICNETPGFQTTSTIKRTAA